MAVVGLDGKKLDKPVPAVTPLSVLKDLVERIENGRLNPEQIFVVVNCQAPDDGSKFVQTMWDNDLSCATSVCILEQAKLAILRMME